MTMVRSARGNAFLLPYCYTKVRMSHGKGVASNADIVFILMVFIKNWLKYPQGLRGSRKLS